MNKDKHISLAPFKTKKERELRTRAGNKIYFDYWQYALNRRNHRKTVGWRRMTMGSYAEAKPQGQLRPSRKASRGQVIRPTNAMPFTVKTRCMARQGCLA